MRYTILLALTLLTSFGKAQTPLLKEGEAVFTFSYGCFPGTPTVPLNPSGWAFLVYDTRNTHNAVPGINWNVGYRHPNTIDSLSWTTDTLGQLFGITIDTIGNIYLAASSIYTTPALVGKAGAGGIYKVDAFTWKVSKFMNTGAYAAYNPSNNLMPNTGPGLGDVCYDKWHHQLFATNFEDGKIYRMSMSGTILSTLDPFTADPGVADKVAMGEIVWAVNVYGTNKSNDRLYFSRVYEDGCSVATVPGYNQVWSVALDPVTGNFSGAPVKELEKPADPTYREPFSDLCFDSTGNMYLAERGMCGNYTMAHTARILKYTNTAGVYGGMQVYYLGGYSGTDAAGGLDLGREYYDDSTYSCEGLIWASCDAIEFGPTDYLYGITGIPIGGNNNIPGDPNYSQDVNIGIDHDQETTINCIPKTGLGDVEIFRTSCRSGTVTPEPEPEPEPPIEIDSCELIKNIVLPNIFTPNGDKKNDSIIVPDLCEEGDLFVFDRWGNEVHHSHDLKLRWDGRNKQKQLVTEGVYYCILRNARINKSWYVHVRR